MTAGDPPTTAARRAPARAAPSTSVVGLFADLAAAERASAALATAGVAEADVEVVVPPPRRPEYAVERRSKAPEGAVCGAAIGGALGGLTGFLAGTGAVLLPGLGLLLAAGPVLGALSTAAVGAALLGAVGAGIGWRIPEFEALPRTREDAERPRVVLSVRCRTAEELERARAVLERQPNDGITVSEESEEAIAPHAG